MFEQYNKKELINILNETVTDFNKLETRYNHLYDKNIDLMYELGCIKEILEFNQTFYKKQTDLINQIKLLKDNYGLNDLIIDLNDLLEFVNTIYISDNMELNKYNETLKDSIELFDKIKGVLK